MYTKRQEKQIEYLDNRESKETLYSEGSYICQCKTCNSSEQFQSAGTVSALFMPQHVGHNTWIITVKG